MSNFECRKWWFGDLKNWDFHSSPTWINFKSKHERGGGVKILTLGMVSPNFRHNISFFLNCCFHGSHMGFKTCLWNGELLQSSEGQNLSWTYFLQKFLYFLFWPVFNVLISNFSTVFCNLSHIELWKRLVMILNICVVILRQVITLAIEAMLDFKFYQRSARISKD